jgi:cysteine desulfurase
LTYQVISGTYMDMFIRKPINLDRNASYGVLHEISVTSKTEYLNPNSVHTAGQRARAAIEEAREEIRLLVDANSDDQIIFTSGATEANNLAIHSALALRGGAVISSAIEHPAVSEPLKKSGRKVSTVFPDKDHRFDPQNFCTDVTADSFVTVMTANNETGQILPLAQTVAAIRNKAPGAIIHSDASQAIGKIPFSFQQLGLDLATISGHKFGALPGIGALIVRRDLKLTPLITGGPQEYQLRAGTENVPGIVSMGIAANIVRLGLNERAAKMKAARDYFSHLVAHLLIKPTLSCDDILPNTLHLMVPNILADDLVVAMDLGGVLISSGSACASGKPDPSPVLLALGYSKTESRQGVRLSFGDDHTNAEIEYAAQLFIKYVEQFYTTNEAAYG